LAKNITRAVGLEGETSALADLRRIFNAGPPRVVELEVPPDRKITALMADDLNDAASGPDALAVAQRLMALINGATFALDSDRSHINTALVYEQDAAGNWNHGTNYASLTVLQGGGRLEAKGLVVMGPDEVPIPPEDKPPRPATWIALADGADADSVTDILHALGRDPDWFDLWKAWEMIQGDRHVIPSWPSDDIEWFCSTATLYRHARNSQQGRKALKRLEEMQKPQLALTEARRLTARLVTAWLNWKAGLYPA